MRKVNTRWTKDERELPQHERKDALERATDLILASDFVLSKLKNIIEEDIEKTYIKDEDVGTPEWTQRALANAGARKALRNILKLIP